MPSPLLSATTPRDRRTRRCRPGACRCRSARKRRCLSTRQPPVEPEVGQHELRRLERAVAVAQRHPDAVVAEADDVGAAVAGDVGEEARMFVHAPAAGVGPKSSSTGPRQPERAVAVAQRDEDAVSPKPTMSGPAVAARCRRGSAGACRRASRHRTRGRRARTSAAAKVPSPLLSAVHTPASPKPTMSARPCP